MNPPAEEAPPPNQSIRWEIATAYLAAAAKVGAWALVTALLIRSSRAEFAIFALVRGTLGLLNYTSFGLAPAMVKVLAEAREAAKRPTPLHPLPDPADPVLSYASPPPPRPVFPGAVAYSNGLAVAFIAGAVGLVCTIIYAALSGRIHVLPLGEYSDWLSWLVLLVGTGITT